MNFLSILVFVILQILFIPLAILGVLLVAYKQMLVSRRLGVSSTAIEVLNGRWTMHVFGIRSDQASVKLARALPNNSIFGLWLALFPLYLKYRISGKLFAYPKIPEQGQEGVADLVIARTLYFDHIIERNLDNVEQFVMLGAGYDTRAYGELKHDGLKFFELDEANTQRLKLTALEDSGIESEHVTFVEVDFSQEDWYEKLESVGYESAKPTIFLWEGVTLYLSQKDVRKSLQEIRTKSAVGSVIVADIYSESFVTGAYIRGGKTMNKSLKLTDEELGFGLPMTTGWEESLKSFLESERLEVGETHFMGRASMKGPYAVVAEIKNT